MKNDNNLALIYTSLLMVGYSPYYYQLLVLLYISRLEKLVPVKETAR